ncbi:aspartate 1-decarboxylase [Oxynema sp. CENA135]|uniref:aspartate 1-decarboxylase n=1 Tax=Oxynema sp. CENA135 TaxID=984206 RepID=UPI001909F706|nr:aspartate 1-decarboxylase [Oxynema sp. CENA135]MBK4731385.1 aspartate 1-decarboxylase [Oxynema sp. CENA135]
MQRTLLLAKIHNCTLTRANLDYVGSISIDLALLEAAGILPYEQVQVVNVANGQRLMTYAIAAPSGSGNIELNGAAARLGMAGDRVIIMSYGQFTSEEAKTYSPTVVFVDERNRLQQVCRYRDLNVGAGLQLAPGETPVGL